MIAWTSSIPKGTSLDSVKQIQPDYIEINWKNPETFKNEQRFIISKIKGDNDILNMEYYLVFIDNKYQGQFAEK